MKVSVVTLGCRVNQSESDLIESSLREVGATIVGLDQAPEYCVINTCTVTAKSDYQSRQMIRRAVRAGAKVIVTGCYAELKSEEALAIAGVVRTVRNTDKPRISSMITGNEVCQNSLLTPKSRPYLKIQDGCNCRCSYCSVPLARGASRSIPTEEVIRNVQRIADSGYHEVVLTGIHLGSYGRDLTPRITLSELLGLILKNTTIHRVRLSSLEVNEIDDQLLEIMRDQRICNHLHIPLQSGSGAVLSSMNRNYSPERFRDAVGRISRNLPNVGLGSDIITGFPGEGDEEFRETLELVEQLPFTYLHVFPFSVRQGTKAASLPGQVPRKVAQERASGLIGLARVKKDLFHASQVGKVLEAIIEQPGPDNRPAGTTGNYLKVKFGPVKLRKGAPVLCRIISYENGSLIAKVL